MCYAQHRESVPWVYAQRGLVPAAGFEFPAEVCAGRCPSPQCLNPGVWQNV